MPSWMSIRSQPLLKKITRMRLKSDNSVNIHISHQLTFSRIKCYLIWLFELFWCILRNEKNYHKIWNENDFMKMWLHSRAVQTGDIGKNKSKTIRVVAFLCINPIYHVLFVIQFWLLVKMFCDYYFVPLCSFPTTSILQFNYTNAEATYHNIKKSRGIGMYVNLEGHYIISDGAKWNRLLYLKIMH